MNGQRITQHATPCSYLTIQSRNWSASDTLEVVMPYTPHTDYGPDKVNGEWLGARMSGPLVLCTDSTGTVIPDYAADRHITHYFPKGK